MKCECVEFEREIVMAAKVRAILCRANGRDASGRPLGLGGTGPENRKCMALLAQLAL